MDHTMDSQLMLKPGSSTVSQRYCWINLAGISLGFFCLNTGYSIFYYIMSSLHSKGGLGTTTLAVDYITQMLTSLFVPPLLARKIGCKWTLVLCGAFITIYITTNLASSFITLIPGALAGGVGYSTMFATKNIVVSDLAVKYATLTGSSEEAVQQKIFSLFYGCFSMGVPLASVTSSQILSSEAILNQNTSFTYHALCGAQFCGLEEQFAEDINISFIHNQAYSVPQPMINNLAAVSIGFVGLGIILILTLLHSYNQVTEESTDNSISHLLATVRFLREPNLLLLIPITVTIGLMDSFISADYTQGFVTCSMGIHYVGLTMLCYGVILSVGSILSGFMAAHIPRMTLFLGTVIVNIIDLLLMLLWTPDPQYPAMFYIISALWGFTFTVWYPQFNALYSDIFAEHPQEAFSNQCTWIFAGFFIGFSWSHSLCMRTKIYLVLGFLVTGTAGYVLVERRILIKQRGIEEF